MPRTKFPKASLACPRSSGEKVEKFPCQSTLRCTNGSDKVRTTGASGFFMISLIMWSNSRTQMPPRSSSMRFQNRRRKRSNSSWASSASSVLRRWTPSISSTLKQTRGTPSAL